jgi:hypothetical protein
VKAVGAGEEGDGRGGHDAGAFDARARFAQAGGKRGGDPGAGLARVAAEKDFGLSAAFAQRVASARPTA